jgi:hypothetical protein
MFFKRLETCVVQMVCSFEHFLCLFRLWSSGHNVNLVQLLQLLFNRSTQLVHDLVATHEDIEVGCQLVSLVRV